MDWGEVGLSFGTKKVWEVGYLEFGSGGKVVNTALNIQVSVVGIYEILLYGNTRLDRGYPMDLLDLHHSDCKLQRSLACIIMGTCF